MSNKELETVREMVEKVAQKLIDKFRMGGSVKLSDMQYDIQRNYWLLQAIDLLLLLPNLAITVGDSPSKKYTFFQVIPLVPYLNQIKKELNGWSDTEGSSSTPVIKIP